MLGEHDSPDPATAATTATTATLVDLTAGENRYPAPRAARLGADVAAALADRHARGLVHGAITPAAVVVLPSNRLGLRDPTDPTLARPDHALWTAYAAPEQLLDGQVTSASDVYALGGLLYLMVTGAPPFPEFDAELLRERKLQSSPPPPAALDPLIPAAFDELIRRTLDRDPAARPSAQEVTIRLEDLARVPTTMPPPVRAARPRRRVIDETTTTRPARPDPWVYVLAGVAALAVLALVLALVLRDDSPAKTAVPAVTGLRVGEATQVLQADHLRVDTATTPDATVAAGIVASQTPLAGTRVGRGRTVVLTVSSGAPALPTPVPIPVPVPQNSGTQATTTTTSTTTSTTTTTSPPAPAP